MNSRGLCSVLSVFVIAGGAAWRGDIAVAKRFSYANTADRSQTFLGNAMARGRTIPRRTRPRDRRRADEPNTYYFGAVAGGVWKTTDGGANWKPLFDKQAFPPSARSRSRLLITTSSTSAPAKPRCAATSPTATAFINRSMPGKSWKNVGLKDTPADRRDHRQSEESEHRLRRRARSRLRAERGARNFSHHRRRQDLDESSGQRRKHRRRSMSSSIRIIRTSSSPRSGRRAGSRGFSPAAGRAAGSIARKTTASPGSNSRATDCPTAFSDASA